MNESSSPSPETPDQRDVTGFLKALLLGATLAFTAQKSEAAVAPPKLDRAPADDLTQRLERARTLLAAEQTGTAALIPGGDAGAAQTMWWRNWGNWHPGWGNGGWRNIAWHNGGWGNGGWHNWHNWRNF